MILDTFEALRLLYTIEILSDSTSVANLGKSDNLIVKTNLQIYYLTKTDLEIRANNTNVWFVIRALVNKTNYDLVEDYLSVYLV